jgi:hypothetical protein
MELRTLELWKDNTMKIQNTIEKLENDLFKFIMVVRSSTRQCEVLSTMKSTKYAIQNLHHAHVGCKVAMLAIYGCYPTQKTYGLIET